MLISYATLHDSHEGDASMDLACRHTIASLQVLALKRKQINDTELVDAAP